MIINIASINVNVLNNEKKQMLLHAFINQHKLDIVYIQEHNIREMSLICKELISNF